MMTERNIRVICVYYGLAALAGLLLSLFVGTLFHQTWDGLAIAFVLSFLYGASGAVLNLRAMGRCAADCMLVAIGGKLIRGFLYIGSVAGLVLLGAMPEQPFLSMALLCWICYLGADVASVCQFSTKPHSTECF